jgi:hypothetical protein
VDCVGTSDILDSPLHNPAGSAINFKSEDDCLGV